MAIGLICLGVVARLDKPFPGFWLSPHGHAGATDLSTWTGPRAGIRPGDRVITFEGAPLTTTLPLLERVRAAPVGTPFQYGLADGRQLKIPSMAFSWPLARAVQLPWLLAALVQLWLGGWVLTRQPRTAAARAHWHYCQAFALFLLGGVAGQCYPWLFELNYVGTVLMLPAFVDLALAFPVDTSGHRVAAQLRRGSYAITGTLLLGVGLAALDDRFWAASFATNLLLPSLALLGTLAWWAWIACAPRFAADARAQARLAWLGLAVSFLPSVAYSGFAVAGLNVPGFEFAFLGFTAFPAAIAYAIVRHDAFDINRFVRRATAYTLATASLAALYLAVVALARPGLGQGGGSRAAGLFAALAVAAAFRPLHERALRGVDRFFLGPRADTPQVAAAVAQAQARDAVYKQIVHDLGTDLSNIAIATDLARRDRHDEAPLASIDASLVRIQQFLAEKRSSLTPAWGQSALSQGVALALATVAPQAARRRQRLECPPLPDCRIPLSEVELAQALGNVLANAVKYSPEGGTVSLTAKIAHGRVQLSITDEGPGIPEALLAHLGTGRRADAAQPGTGLGLQNTWALATRSRGTLSWRNLPQGGACVELAWPLLTEAGEAGA